MSSSPNNLLDNLQIADGYLEEAWAFIDQNGEDAQDLSLAQDYIRKVIARTEVSS